MSASINLKPGNRHTFNGDPGGSIYITNPSDSKGCYRTLGEYPVEIDTQTIIVKTKKGKEEEKITTEECLVESQDFAIDGYSTRGYIPKSWPATVVVTGTVELIVSYSNPGGASSLSC